MPLANSIQLTGEKRRGVGFNENQVLPPLHKGRKQTYPCPLEQTTACPMRQRVWRARIFPKGICTCSGMTPWARCLRAKISRRCLRQKGGQPCRRCGCAWCCCCNMPKAYQIGIPVGCKNRSQGKYRRVLPVPRVDSPRVYKPKPQKIPLYRCGIK
jgi:hypothetical protein